MTPRYGLVVTDGVAGRVFMLVSRTYPDPEEGVYTGDERLVWNAVQIATPGGFALQTSAVLPARVFLAPGEFAEVRT